VEDPIDIKFRHTGIWSYMDIPYGYEWEAYDNFYNGIIDFADEGMPSENGIDYYVSADGTKVFAFIREDVFGCHNAFNESGAISVDARFAPVTVVFYDLEMFKAADEAGDVVYYGSFCSADNVEMYKELNDIGADEFFEKYYGKNR